MSQQNLVRPGHFLQFQFRTSQLREQPPAACQHKDLHVYACAHQNDILTGLFAIWRSEGGILHPARPLPNTIQWDLSYPVPIVLEQS